MMTRRTISKWLAVGATAWATTSAGCMHDRPRLGAHAQDPPIAVPPPGTVPTALNMVALPEYVIEPPDQLTIEVVIRNLDPNYKESFDKADAGLKKAKEEGKPDDEIKRLEAKLKELEDNPTEDGTVRDVPYQPIRNNAFQVQPDGFVYLGVYGSVPVSGLTLNQARQAIRSCIAKQIEGGVKEDKLLVVVSVTQYNSKWYYVHTDGGGAGEQVFRFPVTGKETVSDAITNIGGLPQVASKRNIWVARRTPQLSADQILPVDWVGISQWNVAVTDYQLFPGDKVYVKAQRLVTVDTTLSRILAPVQQLFGVTLLGTQTVNQISGRGIGFGGTGVR